MRSARMGLSPTLAKRLCFVLVAASMALNVWLLLRASAHGSRAARDAGASDAPRRSPGSASPGMLPYSGDARLEACRRVLEAAQRERDAAHDQLAEVVTPQQRFESSERDEAMEARVREPIRAALAPLSGVEVPPIECRGEICQLRISARTRAEVDAATDAVRTDPAIGALTEGFVMEAGTPVAGGFAVPLYIITRATESPIRQITALIDEVRNSGVIARCAAAGLDRGTLEAQISVVPDNAALVLNLGGSLSGTGVGQCIGDALGAAVSAARVPLGSSKATVYASFDSPHGP